MSTFCERPCFIRTTVFIVEFTVCITSLCEVSYFGFKWVGGEGFNRGVRKFIGGKGTRKVVMLWPSLSANVVKEEVKLYFNNQHCRITKN